MKDEEIIIYKYHLNGNMTINHLPLYDTTTLTIGDTSKMKDDKFEGCGIKEILATDSSDPFHSACVTHDKAYEKDSVMQRSFSRKYVDKLFLAHCLEIAGTCWPLKVKAYVYYGIVRAVGWLYWEGKHTK